MWSWEGRDGLCVKRGTRSDGIHERGRGWLLGKGVDEGSALQPVKLSAKR